jgi:hypothetical protein
MNKGIEGNISSGLHDSILAFIESNPGWSVDRVLEAGLALFLLQNEQDVEKPSLSYRTASRSYVEAMFQEDIA